MQTISVLDYHMGNIQSVVRKVQQLGHSCKVINTPEEVLKADKLILPGVGHFGKAMEQLNQLNLIEALNTTVLEKKTPILGICLGMQLMAKSSEEGKAKGLGWFDADIVRLKVSDTLRFKVPHTGWNQVQQKKKSRLIDGISENAEFYFVHAYHIQLNDESDALHETVYETSFVSAIEKENIFGVQYHPEKSHDVGERLLKNFLALE